MNSYFLLVLIGFIWMSQTKIKGLNFSFSKKKLITTLKIHKSFAPTAEDCSSFYVGCFVENNPNTKELKQKANIVFPTDILYYEGMTIERCIIYCDKALFKYAALKNG